MSKIINQIKEGYSEARKIGTIKASDNLNQNREISILESSSRTFGIATYTYYSPIIGIYDYITKGPRDKETGLRQKII